jgi:hypothetical protein
MTILSSSPSAPVVSYALRLILAQSKHLVALLEPSHAQITEASVGYHERYVQIGVAKMVSVLVVFVIVVLVILVPIVV